MVQVFQWNVANVAGSPESAVHVVDIALVVEYLHAVFTPRWAIVVVKPVLFVTVPIDQHVSVNRYPSVMPDPISFLKLDGASQIITIF